MKRLAVLLVFILFTKPALAVTVGIDFAHGENPKGLTPIVYKNQTLSPGMIIRKLVEGLGRNAVLSARLNDKAGLIGALEELRDFTREEREELDRAIETVELLIRENLPVPDELVERIEVLVERIKREVDK